MLENILTRDFCDTWEDQKIINEIFDMENMTEEQIQNRLRELDSNSHAINLEFATLRNEFLEICQDNSEKLKIILQYGEDDFFEIAHREDGLIADYLDKIPRHMTVSVEYMIDRIFDKTICDNWEDQKKVYDEFGWYIDRVHWEERMDADASGITMVEPQLFMDLLDDLIRARCKSFINDW